MDYNSLFCKCAKPVSSHQTLDLFNIPFKI